MVTNSTTKSPAEQRKLLDRVIRAKGLERYALFFVADDGIETPDGYEEVDGYVLAVDSRVFSFALSWDAKLGETALVEWEQTEPEADWAEEDEYRRARKKVGLPS